MLLLLKGPANFDPALRSIFQPTTLSRSQITMLQAAYLPENMILPFVGGSISRRSGAFLSLGTDPVGLHYSNQSTLASYLSPLNSFFIIAL